MTKIYLAGAMYYYSINKNNYYKEWRKEAKDYLTSICDNPIKIISPTDFYEIGENYHKTEKEIMRFDLSKVKESDIILVNLNCLDKSLGTSDEILYAYLLGKPIIGFLDDDSIDVLHPWKIEQLSRIETGKDSIYDALVYIKDYYIDC